MEKSSAKKTGDVLRVGLSDGRVLPLNAWNAGIRKNLALYDVVYVRVTSRRGNGRARRPAHPPDRAGVRAGAGEPHRRASSPWWAASPIPLSQLNRTTQAQRQPGSAIKPLVYLAALRRGLQPNTLVLDAPITLPPISNASYAREQDYWTPKNYDNGASGVITLRRALENSKNLVTVRLLDGGIEPEPARSLDRICELAQEAQVYKDCVRYYPFVLGAQPVRLIDLAAFYAAIANEGVRPTPRAIEEIDRDGQSVYQHATSSTIWVGSADRVAFYQLKTMLQGVVQRGTANGIRHLARSWAARPAPRIMRTTPGSWALPTTSRWPYGSATTMPTASGARLAMGRPAARSRCRSSSRYPGSLTYHAPRAALSPPSREAQRQLTDLPIDLATGERLERRHARRVPEHFRVDRYGDVVDTQYQLVTRDEAYAYRGYAGPGDGEAYGGWYAENDNRPFARAPYWRDPPQPPWGGLFGQPRWWNGDEARRPRRIDPDYLWGNRHSIQ